MNEVFKLGAADAFADRLRDAGAIDPVFAYAKRRWHTAKAHVAKGHEQEKKRLQSQGELIGSTSVAPIAAILSRRMGMAPAAAITAASMFYGALAGNAIGGWEADRRLALSQLRGARGHYAPGPRRKKQMNKERLAAELVAKEAMAQTAGEAETSAPGLRSTSYQAVDTEHRVEKRPGNARRGRGVPEWIRLSKRLPSPHTRGSNKGIDEGHDR